MKISMTIIFLVALALSLVSGASMAAENEDEETHVMAAEQFMNGLVENEFYLMPMSDLINATVVDDQSIVIIDVRPADMYDGGHIQGSINIPDPELVERISEVPMDKKIAVVCQIDTNSAFGVAVLRIFGGHDAWIVQGGVPAWTDAGKELVTSD